MAAVGGRTRWTGWAFLGVVCALVIGFYAWSASLGYLEMLGSGAPDSYYNALVEGFRAGQLNVKREAPPGLVKPGDSADLAWTKAAVAGVADMSCYKGKLYLYFGVTPALVLFWPYAKLTGHFLSHKDAVVIFLSVGFLAGTVLLCAVWRRYFRETGFGAVVAGTLALGLANFAPAILRQISVYEVPISCGYALTMLALAGVWRALQEERRQWAWLAAASLAYGLALGARPSLVFGAIILLVPVAQAWREKRPVRPLLLAAGGPIVLIGLGLLLYNALRFDNPLEFGEHYQVPPVLNQQFSPRFLWFNFRVGFLEPARWSGSFPFVDSITLPQGPKGYFAVDHPFGVLTNIPLVWLALAAPLAWRSRSLEARSNLRWFLGAVALLFGILTLTLTLYDAMCLRYELEYASPLVLLAVIGALSLERALIGQPVWRRAALFGWVLLLTFSAAFNLFSGFGVRADNCCRLGNTLLRMGRVNEAITQYQRAVQFNPDSAEAHLDLGIALQLQGRVEEAIAHFQTALEIKPDDPTSQMDLAWQLATCPETSLRNGAKAVELARRANLLTGGKNPNMLRTLAAAYAEAGRFAEALETAQRALKATETQSMRGPVEALRSELKLYQAGRPFHAPEPTH